MSGPSCAKLPLKPPTAAFIVLVMGPFFAASSVTTPRTMSRITTSKLPSAFWRTPPCSTCPLDWLIMLMTGALFCPNGKRVTLPPIPSMPPSAKPGRYGLLMWFGTTVTPPECTLISSGPRSPTTPQPGPNVPPSAAAKVRSGIPPAPPVIMLLPDIADPPPRKPRPPSDFWSASAIGLMISICTIIFSRACTKELAKFLIPSLALTEPLAIATRLSDMLLSVVVESWSSWVRADPASFARRCSCSNGAPATFAELGLLLDAGHLGLCAGDVQQCGGLRLANPNVVQRGGVDFKLLGANLIFDSREGTRQTETLLLYRLKLLSPCRIKRLVLRGRIADTYGAVERVGLGLR